MFFYLRKRLQRAVLPMVAMMLYAMICVVIIGQLQRSYEAELQNRETLFQSIPVKLTVTSLQGTKANDLQAPAWVAEVFTGQRVARGNLAKYMKDVLLESEYEIYGIYQLPPQEAPLWHDEAFGLPQYATVAPTVEALPQLLRVNRKLTGINALGATDLLLPENGVKVSWCEGYSEEILQSDQWVCLVPVEMGCAPGQKLKMRFQYVDSYGLTEPKVYESEYELTVVGFYSGPDTESVFCPYQLIGTICWSVNGPFRINSVRATLNDNARLEDLKDERGAWFAEPNATGKRTPWDYDEYTYYPYALDINDTTLQRTIKTVDNSILINQLCGYAVLMLASLAGFLVGFLAARQRKREIVLMRTIGAPNWKIFGGFAMEQLWGVMVGIILGGASNLWQPAGRLLTFGVLYALGLVLSLVVFLRTNLLSAMKEEE